MSVTIPITAKVTKMTSFATDAEVEVGASLLVRMVALLASAVVAAGRPGEDSFNVTTRAKTFEDYLTGDDEQ